MPSSAGSLDSRDSVVGRTPQASEASGRLFVVYGRLLGLLLGGYLLFDKAFAYLHLPGVPIRDEPILALLGAFALWGLIRAMPGIPVYRLDALRDSALWYYCLFAFFVAAALAK